MTANAGAGPEGRSRRPGTLVISASSAGGLRAPGLLASDGRYAYVYDYADGRVKVFDRRGTPQWSIGGSTEGTSMFANPTDLQVAPDGAVWLLDAPRRLVTIFDGGGRVTRTIPLPKSVERVVPARDGTFFGLDLPYADVAGYRFSAEGRILSTVGLPTYLRPVPSMARAGVVARAGRTGGMVKAYSYSDYMTMWDSSATDVRTYHAPERVPFAKTFDWAMPGGATATRIAPDATPAALAVTADDGTIYVLYAGRSAERGRVVDSYAATTGKYLGSYVLPFSAVVIAKVPDGFVAVQGGAAPAVRWVQWKPR